MFESPRESLHRDEEKRTLRTNRGILLLFATNLSRSPSFSVLFLVSFIVVLFPLSFSLSTSVPRALLRVYFPLFLYIFLALSSSLIRTDVVSWGQCLLDRILSRNIPVEEKISLSLFPSELQRSRARARTHSVSSKDRF